VTARARHGAPSGPPRDGGCTEFWALEDVSFHVEGGQALGIIGPNGAGKSTLLKLLTRILAPTRGRCEVRGRIGALIEVTAGFHPDLTGRENIFLQGAMMGMKRVEIAQKMDEIIEFAGLGEFIDTQVKRFSSGMSARLGFSIAAHLDPDVLIIDEVLSVGDTAFQQKCVDRMQGFKARGAGIIFVSHHLRQVTELCDRALYVHRVVRAAGPPAPVIEAFLREWEGEGGGGGGKQGDEEGRALEITAATLTDEKGQPVEVLAPGAALRLTVTGLAREVIDNPIVSFALRRSTDGLIVSEAEFTGRDLGLVMVPAGRCIVLRFAFRAHLTRGQYHIGCRIYEGTTRRLLTQQVSVAMLTIDEHRTYAGIADLGLRVIAEPTPSSPSTQSIPSVGEPSRPPPSRARPEADAEPPMGRAMPTS
jgi:lipopolysaccharide transport system ATP-binding protein